MRGLHHFSEDGAIGRFQPRPVAVPVPRPVGMGWLNGPLVWAIDDWHQPLYLFPRDCPRILVWPTERTSDADLARHWPGGPLRMLAYVEEAWLDRIGSARIFRYALPRDSFAPLDDAGMWVSREPVAPERVELLNRLPDRLAACDVLLHPLPDLRPLKSLWRTSLHVSGIRLRLAAGGWT